MLINRGRGPNRLVDGAASDAAPGPALGDERLARLRAGVGTPPRISSRTTAQLTDPGAVSGAPRPRQAAASEPARSNIGPAETTADEARRTGGEKTTDECGSCRAAVHGVPAGRGLASKASRCARFAAPSPRRATEHGGGRIAPASLRELALVDRMASHQVAGEAASPQPGLVDIAAPSCGYSTGRESCSYRCWLGLTCPARPSGPSATNGQAPRRGADFPGGDRRPRPQPRNGSASVRGPTIRPRLPDRTATRGHRPR